MSAKDISDVVKNCAESEVLIAAGLYFIVKTLQGFEAVDASITASAERSPTSERGADYLAVTIALREEPKGACGCTM